MENNSKVIGAGVGGAVGIIVTWCITQFGGVEVPAEVAGAISMLGSAGATYFFPANK